MISDLNFIELTILMSFLQLFRYFLIAGLAYFVFWKSLRSFSEKNRIQPTAFKSSDLKREFLFSILSCCIFGLVLTLSLFNKTEFLTKPFYSEKSPLIIFFQILILILIHDTYFYWMHRTLHHPYLLKKIHRTHHLSTNPSPFAALAFHPAEALLEIIWVMPLIYFLNFEILSWTIFSFIIIIINVSGHLGVETFPRSWANHSLLKFINTPTNHNHHHKYFNGNYGLYFSFWDRLFKSNL